MKLFDGVSWNELRDMLIENFNITHGYTTNRMTGKEYLEISFNNPCEGTLYLHEDGTWSFDSAPCWDGST
jgi:hypothetical protein